MSRGRLLPHRWAVVLVAALLVSPSLAVAGSDYLDKDFSVRFAPAFMRFLEVSANGGETAANRYSSAINPAAAGWTTLPNKLGLVLAPYFSGVDFGAGATIHVFGESLTWDSKVAGVWQPSAAQIRSNKVADARGLIFDYKVDSYQLQWGKRWGDWALGASFNFAKADLNYWSDCLKVTDSDTKSYRFRVGGLYQPAEKWLLGLVLECGFQDFVSSNVVPMPFPMPPMTVCNNGRQHQYVVRPAVSFEYAELSSVFFDYQFAVFHNPGRGILHDHRWSGGIEHRLFDWLLLRALVIVDIRGNVGVGAGVTVFLSRHCALNFGYQYDMYPHIRQEFGRARTVQAVFSVNF